ncbi:unnamed protein product [Eruca vesicaria subsp. sativa]|uniref:Uncharacterized protein n=1 Tax=Eruca vesicaria subsp. sativa TaxID=29727 RepID=A0ABC8JVU5_ERUVS|nr:unnamed protein product [Eruca vesicaria subsp. sativa]
MLTHKSGKCYLGSQADDFIKYFIKKKTHVSFFYDAEELRFEIQSEDVVHVEKREVTMSILGTLISKGYKTVRVRFTVTPRKEDITKSCLEYTFEFDKKINKENNYSGKTKIVESLLTYIVISDSNNRRSDDNFEYNSIYVGYPAEECFKRYVKAFEENVDVNVEDVKSKNRKFTMSFNDAPNLRDPYSGDVGVFERVEVTITITPKKHDNISSRVEWTMKVDKVDDTAKLEPTTVSSASVARVELHLFDFGSESSFRGEEDVTRGFEPSLERRSTPKDNQARHQ